MNKHQNKFKQTEIGMIPEDWELTTFGEISKIRRGASPRPIHDFISTSGIPWVKISDASAQKTRFIGWTNEFIIEKGRENTVIVKPGDLIVSNSATPGIPKFMKINAAIHDGWLLIEPNNQLDKNFGYYLFLQERPSLVGIADGTVFKNLKTDIVRSHQIAIPNINEQQSIAKILSDLDSKIDLNQQMNKTLEAIDQAIFKHWFVDFEFPNEKGKPYKSSGGEMVDSELGKIPKGWRVAKIGDEFETVLGGTPSTTNKSYWENGTVAWINSGKINEFRITEPTAFITEEAVNNSATKLIPKGTTVLAITGATLGQVSRVEIDTCANQSVIGIIESETIHSEYIYYWIKHTIEDIIRHQTGGAQQHINKNNVNISKILIPSEKIIKEYQKGIKPIFDKISLACFEIKNLSQIRDSLLPKLMSGKIRVPIEVN